MNHASSFTGRSPRVVVIDDFVFPYRVPFFLELARQAIDLTVLFCTSRLRSRYWNPPKIIGFKHEFLPSRVLYLKRSLYHDRAIYLTPTLLFRLIRLKPDVVVAYAYSIPTIIAFIYCWLAGKSFISWADGTPLTNQALSVEQKWVRRFIIPRSDACLTPTPDGRETFVSYGARPEKVWMIPHSAAHEFGMMAEGARCRHQTIANRLGIDRPRVLYVGSLVARKGVNYLLEAVAGARQKLGTDIQLLIAGEGPLRATLESQARHLGVARNISFLGFVQPDELPSVYAAAELFLFPSLSDTFAFVIGEAVRCGLPVVASTFAGASKLFIQPVENGFVADPTDIAAFSDAIAKVLCDEDKRVRMGVKSREIADRFSIKEAVKQCVRAIDAALARFSTCHRSPAQSESVENLRTSIRA